MPRLLAILFPTLFLLLAPAAAQELSRDQFRADFAQARELKDDKLTDKAVKWGATHALRYFEELQVARVRGDAGVEPTIEALRAAWLRMFEKTETLQHMQDWVEANATSNYEGLGKIRTNVQNVWKVYSDQISKDTVKQEHQNVFEQLSRLAVNAQSLGHNIEAAEIWLLAGVVGSKMPEKNIDDRRATLDALKQFLEARKAWAFTFDKDYLSNLDFVKAEGVAMEKAAKDDEKRRAEGYKPDSKGIDALLMPNVKQEAVPLKFEALTSWESELDYGPKGGPVPAFWWLVGLNKENPSRKVDWFRRVGLYMQRLGATKFAVTLDPNDPKKSVDIDASNKGKASTFWLDPEKKVPYAMFFWTGTDKEHVGEADHNMSLTETIGNVYYRSAASWRGTFGQDQIVVYDDDASGTPCEADPAGPAFKSPMLGEHDSDGTVVPLLDSMRVGKGPRMPFSEFVQLPGGWYDVKKGKGDDLVLRQFNPEYFKTGKVKFVWTGPKPSTPVQLVVQGEGDFRAAIFDVASGKETDVPVGNYTVIFGRIVIGKGARAQMATIYRGKSQPFAVEEGKVHELKMGAPFTMDFTRRGDQNTTIDALKVQLLEASGCILTDLQNMTLWPEVLAAKAEDGKGAKVVGKFVRFTDPELINKAAEKHNNIGILTACFPMPEGYRSGELILKITLPADGMKVGLSMKKHPVFGVINSAFR